MSEQIKLYGIANCDSVKKARRSLDTSDYEFIDFKKQAPIADQVRHWLDAVGADTLLNKRGTTWRKLDEQAKEYANDAELAALLCQYPTLIKRPVWEISAQGESPSIYVGITDVKQLPDQPE